MFASARLSALALTLMELSMKPFPETAPPDPTRQRILEAAATLLAERGREGVSTRAICEAAEVQQPTLYRLFGDKQGLLEAVALHVLAEYVREKARREPHPDPVEDLRQGWDQHLDFGLAHPEIYAMMYGEHRPGEPSSAATQGAEVLAKKVRRIAEAGRLRVEASLAVQLIHAVGSGVTLSLLALPEEAREPTLSRLARELVIGAITTDTPALEEPSSATPLAATLLTLTPELTMLSQGERGLFQEWLTRIASYEAR